MVQTQASAAGTLSSIIFYLAGFADGRLLGGLSVLADYAAVYVRRYFGRDFTVPLRYAMVVKSDLPYPEGVAAAEILKVGDYDADQQEGGSGIKELVSGGALAGLMSFCASGLRVVADSASFWFKGGASVFQVPMGFSLALLGAGYLVGLTGGIAILLGISIAWGVAVPYLSAHIPQPADMEMIPFAMSLWKEKVRFIGAGTIGIAAIWTLLTLMKPIVEGMRLSFRNFGGAQMTERTEQDLSPKAMIAWVLAMMLVLACPSSTLLATRIFPVVWLGCWWSYVRCWLRLSAFWWLRLAVIWPVWSVRLPARFRVWVSFLSLSFRWCCCWSANPAA